MPRVLLIEDEALVAIPLTRILERAGARVVDWVETGVAAMARAATST